MSLLTSPARAGTISPLNWLPGEPQHRELDGTERLIGHDASLSPRSYETVAAGVSGGSLLFPGPKLWGTPYFWLAAGCA